MTSMDTNTVQVDAAPAASVVASAVDMANAEDTVHLLELGILLARRKRFIVLCGFVLAVITAIATLIMKPTFTAETCILPPQKSKSPLEQLGGLSALAGGGAASALGLKNPDDLYVGLLQSETIATDLIQRFHLMQVYKAKRLSSARKILRSNTKIVSEKSSLISIAVEDHDPKRAAAIANAYVEDLHDLMGHLAITEAGQRRIFFEQQLEQEKNKLADAEVALVQTEQKTGI
ncbi:MAG TPA: Wzz/FepE/Etk N-terminal domain-containing protein, partial [Acidobacteriaceae bacterium]|nr:Wzz/FepE/Etk N-terminal domain-containing protein [Acidobacteriaceae bacterium]